MTVLGTHSAGGKVILLGEHFVVHGCPALAVPLSSARTTVTVSRGPGPGPVLDSPLEGPARLLAERVFAVALDQAGAGSEPWSVRADSALPVGFGLGSSAAWSCALVGALARAAGRALGADALRIRAHELERLIHGQPSGIDDAVVSGGLPLVFRRGEEPRFVQPGRTLTLVLAGCGYPGSTREAVAAVRAKAEAEPGRFAAAFEEARRLVDVGVRAFCSGDVSTLGDVMTRNHALLEALGVCTPELVRLVEAAQSAGAAGAKLTGAGLGGFVVALCDGDPDRLVAGLEAAGGAPVWVTRVEAAAEGNP